MLRSGWGWLAAVLVAASIAPAEAAKLEKEACDALKVEQTSLVTAGVRTDMAQGPDWAKTNLAAERLKQIARLIEVDEQVAFRCPQPLPPPEKTAEPAAKKGKSKAAKKRKAEEEAAAAGGVASEPAPPKTAQPAPKPKKPPAGAAAAATQGSKAEAKPQ